MNIGPGKALNNIITAFIWLSAAFTIGILIWILSYIIIKGIGNVTFDYLFTMAKGNGGGILPMIVSTLYVIFITLAISTPIGICAAIYLVEYAKKGPIVRVIRFSLECLSGIPSIIYGLFGFLLFVTYLHMRFSIMAGALTLSIMVLPTIIRTTEETLKTVPDTYREGSLGLGASKLRTIIKIIIPSAISGILTAVILSIGRIVGETAAVYLTVGMVTGMPQGFMDPGRTLAVHLYLLATLGISLPKAFATATILITIVLVINLLANSLGRKFKKI